MKHLLILLALIVATFAVSGCASHSPGARSELKPNRIDTPHGPVFGFRRAD
jgi:outer membrane murein-binding lipoprotein Lpp